MELSIVSENSDTGVGVCSSERNQQPFSLMDLKKETLDHFFQNLKLVRFGDGNARPRHSTKSDEALELDLKIPEKMYCNTCEISFDNVKNQRAHYKLDWHRFNLKRRLKGATPLSEIEFEDVASDISSISASSSDSESDGDITEKKDKLESTDYLSEDVIQERDFFLQPRTGPEVFFKNDKGELFSIYRCIVQSSKDVDVSIKDVSKALFKSINAEANRKWCIVLIGGGHFAAAIYQGNKAIEHKTFHRYTVRAKQGGSQGVKDNKSGGGSHPKSAGASLRRYNEMALVQDIGGLFESWGEIIASCEIIFYRANTHNKSSLFGGKNPVFNKTDRRLRTIPFPTRRPTFSETTRILRLLSTITSYGVNWQQQNMPSPIKEVIQKQSPEKVEEIIIPAVEDFRSEAKLKILKFKQEDPLDSGASADESGNSDDEQELVLQMEEIDLTQLKEFDNSQVPKPRTKRIRRKKKLVEVVLSEPLKSLFDACKSNDATLLEKAVESNKESAFLSEPLPVSLENQSGGTLLHIASTRGHHCLIPLLLSHGCDPTVVDMHGKVPYVLALDKETRNQFRRYMADNPNQYDYVVAQVPAPLTGEMEDYKKDQRKARKLRQAEKKKEEADKQRFLNLTDREKRALAAERRFTEQAKSTALQESSVKQIAVLSRCFQCGLDMTGKVPFEYSNNRFCSVGCVKAHRQLTKS